MGAKQSSTKYNGNMNFRSNSVENNGIQKEAVTNQIDLEEVYESLEDYKQPINNVYCLNKLFEDSIEEIQDKINEGNANALCEVLNESLNDDSNSKNNIQYCEIIELARSKNEVNSCRLLFSCKKYEELDGMSLINIKTQDTNDKIDDMSYANVGKLLEMRVIEMSRKLPSYGKVYIYSGLGMWTQGVRCYFNLLRKSPFDPEKWIMISSGVDMKHYTSQDVTDLTKFSQEYKVLLENITQVMNSNTYLNIIEESVEEATIVAEDTIAESEEKTALFTFAETVYKKEPKDPYAKAKYQDAKMAAQTASRMASTAVTQAKAAQHALTEAEAHIATKTTTWEYGGVDDHSELHCVYSGVNPQWNGLSISECILRGSNMDIPGITFSVMRDIENHYVYLFHNQTVLCSYKTSIGYHISIVKIIKRGDDTHVQMKDAYLNSIFNEVPSQQQQQEQQQPQQNSSDPENVQKPQTRSHIFMDPTTSYIGIGTNDQIVKYADDYLTTKINNLQHVVIKSQNYPNLVSTRIAESRKHMASNNPEYYYFDQFSSSTMRRESNLYNFDEMYNHCEDSSEESGIKRRYGTDISFEIADKTKKTCEIGNVGMVIDKIDDEGNVYGGFSVKTIPNIETLNNKDVTRPGNTIMYVSSDGVLHISGIALGSKLLTVKSTSDGEEELFWGDNKGV